MATVFDLPSWIWVVQAAIGLPAIILYVLKEGGTNNADSAVAERTVNSSVAKIDLTAIEAQLVTLRSALDMERDSKDRLIGDLKSQLDTARSTITELRAELTTVTGKLREVTEAFEQMQERLEGTAP